VSQTVRALESVTRWGVRVVATTLHRLLCAHDSHLLLHLLDDRFVIINEHPLERDRHERATIERLDANGDTSLFLRHLLKGRLECALRLFSARRLSARRLSRTR
jgi:hypothetical protein